MIVDYCVKSQILVKINAVLGIGAVTKDSENFIVAHNWAKPTLTRLSVTPVCLSARTSPLFMRNTVVIFNISLKVGVVKRE